MSVTMLIAYCDTSVKWFSRNVPPIPPTIVRMPMPRGSPAAITDAKMRTSSSSVTGSVTPHAPARIWLASGEPYRGVRESGPPPSVVSPTKNVHQNGFPARTRPAMNWPIATTSSIVNGIIASITTAVARQIVHQWPTTSG